MHASLFSHRHHSILGWREAAGGEVVPAVTSSYVEHHGFDKGCPAGNLRVRELAAAKVLQRQQVPYTLPSSCASLVRSMQYLDCCLVLARVSTVVFTTYLPYAREAVNSVHAHIALLLCTHVAVLGKALNSHIAAINCSIASTQQLTCVLQSLSKSLQLPPCSNVNICWSTPAPQSIKQLFK